MTTYKNHTLVGADAPIGSAIAVTPSDTVPLPFTTRALWVAVAGDITVIMDGAAPYDGNTVTFASVPAGSWMPIRCKQVKATGTTATTMVACA